jgi:hypothetical protein
MTAPDPVSTALGGIATRRAEALDLLALAEKATPAPWACDEQSGVNDFHLGYVQMPVLSGPNTYGMTVADTRLVAALRNASPDLLRFLRAVYDADEALLREHGPIFDLHHFNAKTNACYVCSPVLARYLPPDPKANA